MYVKTPHPQPKASALQSLYGSLPLAVVLAGTNDDVFFANNEFFTLTECSESDLGLMNFKDVLSIFCLRVCDELSEFLASPSV